MMSSHADMQDKYYGDYYDIYLIQGRYTKVAAFGRHHKRGGEACGRATSFVVSFGEAVNMENIVAVKMIAKEFPWDSLGRADSTFS